MTDDGIKRTFEWDAANRLVAINYNDGNRTEFVYDGLSRRVQILESDGSTKTFVWSGNSIAEERDATGAVVTKRFFAEGEQRVGGADAGNYFYSRDHLGSVREVTDASGVQMVQYDYDAWGNQVVVNGNMSFDFGYTGHYRHAPSNLYLAEYRAYDPTFARWISRDPLDDVEIREGPNLYAYVANDAVNDSDPRGLQAGQPNIGSLGGVIGNRITKSVTREYGKARADCEKVPHSPSGCCKCCVMTLLVQVSGSFWEAKDGWGKVYDKPCDQIRPEFLSESGWTVYWGTLAW